MCYKNDARLLCPEPGTDQVTMEMQGTKELWAIEFFGLDRSFSQPANRNSQRIITLMALSLEAASLGSIQFML